MNQEQRAPSRSAFVRHAAVLTACLGVIALLTTVYWVAALRLPDPAVADRGGLIRWLVLRDLNAEPSEIRVALLERLEEEALAGNIDTAAFESEVAGQYRDRLWGNIQVLFDTWFSKKLESYLAIPTNERAVYLDATISEMERWKGVEKLRPHEGTDTTPSTAAMLKLLGEQVTRQKEKASPERRQQIEEFDTALRWRLFLHGIGLAPGRAS